MDAPPIQYVQTLDGVNIAYYVMGEGSPATLYYSMPHSHLEVEWQIPELREGFLGAARTGTLIRLDPRGFGLSDREIDDFSLDAMLLDIEALVERIGLRFLGIYANGFAVVPAIAFAARHAEMMTHLILNPPAASGEDLLAFQRVLALQELAPIDYKLATETMQRVVFPDDAPEEMIKTFAAYARASIDADRFLRVAADTRSWEADEDAKAVRVRTLLLHDRAGTDSDIARTRRVASLISRSRVVFMDGPFSGGAIASAFYAPQPPDEQDEEGPGEPSGASPTSGTAIILFADIVDSTALSEQLGDSTFRERSRTLEERVRAQITAHAGTSVERRTLGDGVLATFASASDAIRAALACATVGDDVGLALHLGLHAGDVLRENANVYGQAVSIASRVSGLTAPNEVLVSATVRDIARASADVSFEDRGERELKGVSEPVRLFAVRAG